MHIAELLKRKIYNIIINTPYNILGQNIVIFRDKTPFLFKIAKKLALNKFKTDEGLFIGKIDGHKMYFNHNQVELFLKGEYEPEITDIFIKTIQKGDVVIDIGANIGYYTLIAARTVGGNGKVFAFEPDHTNYALLKRNIEINRYKNVIPIKKAVSNANTSAKFFLREDSTVSSLLNDFDKYPSTGSTEVETIILDDFFKDKESIISKIKLIKMDIEGAEMLALLGMSQIIEKNEKLAIISEFNPDFIKKSGYEPEEFISKLKRYGFKIEVIGQENEDVGFIEKIDSSVDLFCYKS